MNPYKLASALCVAIALAPPSLALPVTSIKGSGAGDFYYDPVALTITSTGYYNGTVWGANPNDPYGIPPVSSPKPGTYVFTMQLANQLQITTDNFELTWTATGYRDSIVRMSADIVGYTIKVDDLFDSDFNLFTVTGGSGKLRFIDAVGYSYNPDGIRPGLLWSRYNRYKDRVSGTSMILTDSAVTSDFDNFGLDTFGRDQLLSIRMNAVPSVIKAEINKVVNGPVTEAFTITGGFGTSSIVPEPGVWAMMIVGFGFVGWAARRKRFACA